MALEAQVLYDFNAEPGNNELSVRQGETVIVLDQTVGGGWIEAQDSSGRTGLVPEGYLQVTGDGVGGGESWSEGGALVSKTTAGWDGRGLNTQAEVEDDDSEWDDDWDDQSMGGYHGDDKVEEGGASGLSTSTSTVKISLNKFPFSKGPSPEVFLLAKPPAHCRDRFPVYIEDVGPVWLYPSVPLDCLIADPKKESKLYGLKSFIEYQITPNTTSRPVNHRYKHFDWLYERLLEKFGSALPIPPLPDKQVTGRFEDDFIRMRMEQLQAWMTRMCRHPVVSQSDVFQLFLTYGDEKEWKAGKRKAERDEMVGPLIFSLVEPEAAELDAAEVEQKCEHYSRFTRSMDDGVRELLNVGHTHWKRCTGPLPKEYERIGRAFRNLSTVFTSSRYPGEETLTDALTAAGQTYEHIAEIVAQQPQKDLHFLMETNSEYRGMLGNFPEILAVHKAAVEKVRESDRLVSAGKINNSERKFMNQRLSNMSYSLQAEMNHFHSNRIYDPLQGTTHYYSLQGTTHYYSLLLTAGYYTLLLTAGYYTLLLTATHCRVLHTITHCRLLHTITHCRVLHTTTHYYSLQGTTHYYSLLLAAGYYTILLTATHYYSLLLTAGYYTLLLTATHCRVLHTTTHCRVLHTITHCRVLHTITHCYSLQGTTHYYSLQVTTHYYTLLLTTTRCRVLHTTTLLHTTTHCRVLHTTTSHCTALYYTLLLHTALHNYTLYYTLHYYTLYYTLHYTLYYTLHYTHCTVHTALYTLYCTHCTIHCTIHSVLYTLHYTHCTIHCTIHTVLYTLHYTHCTIHTVLYTALYTLYCTHCTIHTVLYTALYTLHYTLHYCTLNYTLHNTLHCYTLYYTLYSTHCSTHCTIHTALLHTAHYATHTAQLTALHCTVTHCTIHTVLHTAITSLNGPIRFELWV
ncbi:sorting nexin-9 isoform X2 [Labrus bergylta]|uniref:sorting nexin-9 isoform X2 n=1 Tax=Labrus bergylta TaxID=56723 RepID=UPI00331374A4